MTAPESNLALNPEQIEVLGILSRGGDRDEIMRRFGCREGSAGKRITRIMKQFAKQGLLPEGIRSIEALVEAARKAGVPGLSPRPTD